MDRPFARVDVLLLPTLGMTAPRLDEDAGARLLPLCLTPPWNLTGQPAMPVPVGPAADGLPLGAQIVGRWDDEVTVLRVGYALQQATSWHLARPPRWTGAAPAATGP